jgi:mannan endo-1,4-beta-mannosidase
MKPLNLTLILSLITLCSFGQELPVPADKKATKETVRLFQSLYELKNKGVMYGHQDDLNNERSLDSVSFAQIADQIKAHYKRGGVISISWHLNNPYTMQIKDTLSRRQYGTAWDVSSKEVVGSILPGGKNNELFNTWLERLAEFFTGLKDETGTPIPLIFRPYHEHSGTSRIFTISFMPTTPTGELKPFSADFKNFYNSQRTLFLKEVQQANVYKRR